MRMPTLNQQDGRERNANRRTARGRHPGEASRGEAISGTNGPAERDRQLPVSAAPRDPGRSDPERDPPLNSTLLSNHLLGLTNVRAPPRHTCYGPVRGGQRRREDESLSTRAPERPGQGARNADAGIWVGTSRNALYPTAFFGPSDPNGHALLAGIVRSLFPTIEQSGIATSAEGDIDTLQRRLHEEIQAARAADVAASLSFLDSDTRAATGGGDAAIGSVAGLSGKSGSTQRC